MTASGSLPLLVILLALVVAAAGYAGGRLHQWWRAGRDRDQAYQDGYDTATRSVFSLAARAVGPGRPAARGSVTPPGPALSPTPVVSPFRPPKYVAPTEADRVSPSVRPPAGAPSIPLPHMPGSSELVRSNSASHFITDRPLASGDRAGDVVPLIYPFPDPVVSGRGQASASVRVGGRPLVPAPRTEAGAGSPGDVNEWWRGTETSARDRSRHGRLGTSSADPVGDGPDPTTASPGDAETGSSGRHTVPDELVQAATYRLPPDRVFRAKVRERTADERPEDATIRLPEPPAPPSP